MLMFTTLDESFPSLLHFPPIISSHYSLPPFSLHPHLPPTVVNEEEGRKEKRQEMSDKK
jgi:hypothetical protein